MLEKESIHPQKGWKRLVDKCTSYKGITTGGRLNRGKIYVHACASRTERILHQIK